MNKEKNDIEKTFEIKIQVKEKEIKNILCDIESAISYWGTLDIDDSIELNNNEYLEDYLFENLLNNKTISIIDIENNNKKYSLTLEKLLKGIGLNFEKRSWDSHLEDIDSVCRDSIIQYALFGELMYS